MLVIRFSALGDVAMTIPVIAGVARANKDVQITFLTQQRFAALQDYLPDNVRFIGADLRGEYSGTTGLNRLLQEIDYKQFDMVADLHDVWRTKYLRWRCMMAGCKVRHINKGRWEKHLLTRSCHKVLKPLPTSIERYERVFQSLCLKTDSAYQPTSEPLREGIGIAPFAAHSGKIYPLEKMEEVVKILNEKGKKIYLFGGGIKEIEVLTAWEKKYQNCRCVAGKMTMAEELNLMGHLEVMLTMDSANMHLASLVGTRVVSVWGATHPYTGFLGYGQKVEDCVQLDLPCRPCSIYGKKKCKYGDYHCLTEITPEEIIKRIERL